MFTDYIVNGQGHGDVGVAVARGLKPYLHRPFIANDGRSKVVVPFTNPQTRRQEWRTQIANAEATLTKNEWELVDQTVLGIARPMMVAFNDLRAINTVNIPNAMGVSTFQYQTVNIQGVATLSMDPDRDSERFRPGFELKNLPLPVIHSDGWFSEREIEISRNSGSPLDLTAIEEAARVVAELAEKLTVGTVDSYTYNSGTIYGMTNFPNRLTKTMTNPATGVGWTPSTAVEEVIDMVQDSIDNNFMGPWVLYTSPAWSRYLDNDYSDVKGTQTLRQRLAAIDGISRIQQLQYLGSGYIMVLVQQSGRVARAVVGMMPTTLQWPSNGGMRRHFKVMAILVPQFRADAAGQTGIVHATTA